MNPADQVDIQPTLPFHDPSAFKAAVRLLHAAKVSLKAVDDLLVSQGAPAIARLEARIFYERPANPFALTALLHGATRTGLIGAVPEACRRYKVHPLSVVSLETNRPLGLGRELGLPDQSIRSVPGKRREGLNAGLWSPRSGTAVWLEPKNLVLERMILADQPELTTLPENLRVLESVTLDRLPLLQNLGGLLDEFRGALRIRCCDALQDLPEGTQLRHLTLDGQPWDRFPRQPLQALRLELRHMTRLTELRADIETRLIELHDCPALTQIPLLPGLISASPAPMRSPREGNPWGSHGLTLRNCHKLESLPRGFRVPGTLVIRDCESFRELPPELDAWCLELNHLPALRRLPAGLRLRGRLVLNGLSHLEALPDDLQIEGNLSLLNVTQQLEPPANLKVGGVVHLHPSQVTPRWHSYRLTHGTFGPTR